jgi:hypothetical protein
LLETEPHLYVERVEDGQIVTDVRRGNYVALMGARQTGKTSLLLKLRRQLLEEGYLPMYLDLSPARDGDEERWYRYFRTVMLEQLRRSSPGASVPPIGDSFDFREALRQISQDLPPFQRVVFLLDEVSALPPAISDRFFSMVHTVCNERRASPVFQRYVFVLAGAFIPDELVRDPSIKSFSIASRIYTSDAAREGIAGLACNLERAGYTVSDAVLGRIYHWTAGHVFLTQRVCSVLERSQEAHLTPELVDTAVDDLMDDRNIGRVFDRLDELPEEEAILHRILAGEEPLRFNRASRLVTRLELIGVIKLDADGYCTVRNAIYRKALGNGSGHRSRRIP